MQERVAKSANPFDLFLRFNPGASQIAKQSVEPMMKSAMRCQLEVGGLMSRRAQAYVSLPSTMARCRTPQDLFAEQAKFWQTAMEQYAEAGRRLFGIAAEMPQLAAFRPATEEIKRRDWITFPEPAQPAREARSRPAADDKVGRKAA